jgi:hypothetical protein
MDLRVTLDCYVSISDRIQEGVARRLSSQPDGARLITKSNADEITERYRRLLHAVLSNWWYTDWAVRTYLARRINTTWEITPYDVGLEQEDEKEMLALILGRLDAADADFFRGVCGERWLLAQDDPFWDCFEFGLSSAPKVEGPDH